MARGPFSYKYPRPALTVDIAALTYHEGLMKVVLVKRGIEPYKGSWVLPGGFVNIDEPLVNAAKREMAEETGLALKRLEGLGFYGTPGRDPRGRTISCVFIGFVRDMPGVTGGDDAEQAAWFDLYKTGKKTGFDHGLIIRDVRKRLKQKALLDADLLALLPVGFSPRHAAGLYGLVTGRAISASRISAALLKAGFAVTDGRNLLRRVRRKAALDFPLAL